MSSDPSVADRPLVSFALPVRDGAPTIAQAIESVQGQTLENWELVISDNHSSDGTSEICASYARDDDRILHRPTLRSLSQNENFSEAYRQTRGTFFRWYGDDDWLEPIYAERTVAALTARPEAVLCTTLQRYYRAETPVPLNANLNTLDGIVAADPAERLVQFLHVLEEADWFGIDPVYSLARRDAVARTRLVTPNRFGDFIFACEMALLGTFTHVPDVLAHRRLAETTPSRKAMQRFTNKSGWRQFVQREIALLRVWEAAGRHVESRHCLVAPMVAFALREHADGARRRARAFQARSRTRSVS